MVVKANTSGFSAKATKSAAVIVAQWINNRSNT
jgi:hypothetical protein